MVSQQAHLYAHHLSRCPSYSAAHHTIPVPEDDDSLPKLRRLFAREIKRNLFEAYLRPKETIINLVSTSISSSSAPGGEAFHFSLSPRGHYVLAYSSSRIHVIDVTGPAVIVKRELKILRRPASTTITDDGSLLAVLSTDLQIDLYDLTGDHPKHSRVVALDHTPRTIALSPTGSVLAAAYDSGVEVSSLDPDCTSTERRAVKCYAVDSLSFSPDGTQLLGTTIQSRSPSTVVLTAPYFNPGGSLPEESISALWTTSILFPNGSRDCSHAVLLPSPMDDEASWTFTYDRVFETFRAVRIDDLRNGTTYFTGPTADFASISKLLPSTLPAASESGDIVAAGFQGSIWLYGVPEDLEALPTLGNGTNSNNESEVSTPSSQLGRRNSAPSLRSSNRPRESISRTPQWQLLCDRFRNTFVEGRKISSLNGVSSMCWISDCSTSFHGERLVAVAPGVGSQPSTSEDDGMSPTDGGRLSVLDFSYGMNDGAKTVITIEVGAKEPEILEEEHRDIDAEVAIVRRRTVAQRRGNRSNVSRSATIVARSPRPDPVPMPTIHDFSDPFGRPLPGARRLSQQTTSTDQSETASIDEQEAFDAPYSHTNPRSTTTLRRAATAAAVNRRLHPRAVAQEHIEFRRADGREEHPHESDADNWVPPPPPYTKDPVPPLPEHIQRSLLAEAAQASLHRANTQRAPSIDFPGLDSGSLYRSRTIASSSTGESRRNPFQRTLSDSTARTTGGISLEDEGPRPVTSPVSPDFDDLYDVSPPGTPQPAPRRAPVNQIPRRPVGANSGNTTGSFTPSPAMRATLQQPVSPIPQPQPRNETLDRRLLDWEGSTESNRVSASSALNDTTLATSSAGLTRGRMEQDVPPRPNDDHRLSEPPPPTPILQNHRERLESEPEPLARRSETAPTRTAPREMDEEPLPIWRRAGTAPAATSQPASAPTTSGVVMPSADQLARLSSRKGRPPGHILSDPSRRNSGTVSPHRMSVGGHSNTPSWGSMQNTPPRLTQEHPFRSTPPRAVVGAHASSASRSNTGYSPSHSPYSSSPSRRISAGHSRQGSSSSPNLRPPLQRLDTIHSMTSNGEPSPFIGQKAMTLGRQPSKAQRSAAKNIKDAKKKGWRASMKKEKQRYGDTASSAGWTDVSTVSGMDSFAPEKDKKTGGKCLIM